MNGSKKFSIQICDIHVEDLKNSEEFWYFIDVLFNERVLDSDIGKSFIINLYASNDVSFLGFVMAGIITHFNRVKYTSHSSFDFYKDIPQTYDRLILEFDNLEELKKRLEDGNTYQKI